MESWGTRSSGRRGPAQISPLHRLGAMDGAHPPQSPASNAKERQGGALAGTKSRLSSQALAFLLLLAALALVVALGLAVHSPAVPYAGLFVTSLIAGSVLPFLPGSSELAMAGLLATEIGRPALIIIAAIVGTVLGASANYVIGRHIARFSGRRWFPLSPGALENASNWFARYGVWVLLMCWVPTAGDAMTVVAGLLRADVRLFLILTAAGKAFGHLAVASGVTWVV
jgi:membrane protein YqaA with SNARE-associated domain